MLRFKQFLMEAPLPPVRKDLQDFVRPYEIQGNEDQILGLHGSPADPTIGVGHSLNDSESSRKKLQTVAPDISYENLRSGKAKLTKDQVQSLSDLDTDEHIQRLRDLVPDIDDYTPDAQKGLYSSTYRGTLGGSPKALSLLKQKQYDAAADELLNNAEYRASRDGVPIKGKLLPGIAKRMEAESALIRGESDRRNNNLPLTGKAVKTAISVLPKAIDTVTKLAEPLGGTPTQPKKNKPVSPVSDNDHTIQSGETLWKLTKGDPAKIKQIQAANPGLDPNKLSVGQKIKMPR
jgi:LysM repeat protein